MTIAAATPKRGALQYIGPRRLGLDTYRYWECTNCKTIYPEIDGLTRCNGHNIELCPWCREDSAPWKDGRGC